MNCNFRTVISPKHPYEQMDLPNSRYRIELPTIKASRCYYLNIRLEKSHKIKSRSYFHPQPQDSVHRKYLEFKRK